LPIEIAFGRRVFAPSWLMTGLTLVLLAAFIGLGHWQWDRAAQRRVAWEAFARGADAPRPLGERRLDDLPRFQRITLTGRYLPQHQFLLDNRTHAGQAGYEVLTPFRITDGRTILIDRGWVAFTGYRERLPDVTVAAEHAQPEASVSGRVDELPSPGLASGRAAPAPGEAWPKVTSYPSAAQLAAALGAPIERRILLLDRDAPQGYLRDWQPPGMPPERHLSYALQWWIFALVLAGLYLFLNLRRAT
jgi:surfeit locus 1 family protein